KEGAARPIEIIYRIARIFSYAHHLEFAALSRLPAEVLADRIFVSEKLTRECLTDDGYMPRNRRILLGDAAPFDDRGPDDVKVSRCHSIPRSEVIIPGPWSGLPIHPDASAPTPPGGEYRQRATEDTPGRLAIESWMR